MRLAVVALLLAGCVQDPAPEPATTSQIAVANYIEHPPASIDVLVVVDNTTAMAPYQSKLPQLAANVASVIHETSNGFADIHIAATTNGGALSSVLTDRVDWFGNHEANFDHSLADALTPLLDVGASAPGPSQPLAAMHDALVAPSTLLREHAALVVITVAGSDDGSPAFDYVSFLKNAKSDPARVVVVGLYPPGSANLDAFHAAFPDRSSVVPIASDDYAAGLAIIENLALSTIEGLCFPPPLDPAECVVTAVDNDIELAQVPHCEGDGAPPSGSCWAFVAPDDAGCSGIDGWVGFEVRGLWTYWVRPRLRVECVVK